MRPQIWDSRVWSIGAGAFRDARQRRFSTGAARVYAAVELSKHVPAHEIEESIPQLESVGSVVFPIARRALRILNRKR